MPNKTFATFKSSIFLFLPVFDTLDFVLFLQLWLQAQSYKFVPLVYQIASRMGSSKDSLGPHNFQVLAVLHVYFFLSCILLKCDFVLTSVLELSVCFGFSCEENGYRPSIPYHFSGI